MSRFSRQTYSQFTVYLRNRSRGEAVAAETDYVRSEALLERMMPFGISIGSQTSGFAIHRSLVHFPPRYLPGRYSPGPTGKFPVLGDDWLREAELVVVRSTYAGAVQRTVEIGEFPLSETSPATTRITAVPF